MKIEITEDIISGIASHIRKEALTHITGMVRQLEDEELPREIRLTTVTNKEKVVAYLQRTNINGGEEKQRFVQVSSEYVRKGLLLHPHEMKPVRDELETERIIWTYKKSRVGILIYYRPT